MSKQNLRRPALCTFGIYLIYAAVLAPLYRYIATDYVLCDTVFFDIVDALYQIFEILGITAIIGFLCHGVYRFTYQKCLPLYLLSGGALLFKYVVSVVAISIVDGTLDLTADFTAYLISLSIELLSLVFAVFLTHKLTFDRVRLDRERARAAETLGKEYRVTTEFLPFQRLFSRTNHLQRAAFWSILLFALLRVVAYIIDEIAFSVMGAFFTPADIPITLLYWALLIFLPAFLGYLLALGCMLWQERTKE